MRSSLFILAAFLLISALLGTPRPLPAQERSPYTLEQVEDLLRARLAPSIILAMVRTDCIAFRIDETARQRLTAAGAEPGFVELLGDVCYRGTEPEPQPQREPETPPATPEPVAASLPFSPGSAAIRSLFIPGLGQFYTGRPVAGAVFLAGWAGALGFGLMSQKVTVECLAQTDDSCPSGQVRSEIVERPMLMAGLGAAVALAVISAFEARSGARKANAARMALMTNMRDGRLVLEALPPPQPSHSGGLVLLQLRHR